MVLPSDFARLNQNPDIKRIDLESFKKLEKEKSEKRREDDRIALKARNNASLHATQVKNIPTTCYACKNIFLQSEAQKDADYCSPECKIERIRLKKVESLSKAAKITIVAAKICRHCNNIAADGFVWCSDTCEFIIVNSKAYKKEQKALLAVYKEPREKKFTPRVLTTEYKKVGDREARKDALDFRCPRPYKKVYRTNEEAVRFIEEYHPDDKGLRPYKCRCKAIHIGH